MELKVLNLQKNAGKCVICGVQNLFSLNARFYELNKDIVCTVTKIREEHQSYPGRTHGGIITALLDETIGRAIQINNPNIWGVTSTITVKFRKPVPLDENIKCFGRITRNSALGFVGVGVIENELGELLATAEATYIKMDLDKIEDEHGDGMLWDKFPEDRPPKFVKLLNPKALGLEDK